MFTGLSDVRLEAARFFASALPEAGFAEVSFFAVFFRSPDFFSAACCVRLAEAAFLWPDGFFSSAV